LLYEASEGCPPCVSITPVVNTSNAAMSEGATADVAERVPRRRRVLVVAALGLILVSGLGGIAWGQRHPVVHVDETSCLALESQIGCTLPDGWDIGVSTDVSWTDATGVFHEGGRPECLTTTSRGASEPVLLHWLKTASGDRYVVEVTCEG
jgi:hypothetical protein